MKRPLFTHWTQIVLPLLYGVILGAIMIAWSEGIRPDRSLVMSPYDDSRLL